MPSETPPSPTLARVCRDFEVTLLYVFGSRAEEVRRSLAEGTRLEPGGSDVDVAVRVAPGALASVRDKVRLSTALEDLLGCTRVDLVLLREADAFLAEEAIRGERLYASDSEEADEYDLYVLRRAGDLAPLERERAALVLEDPS